MLTSNTPQHTAAAAAEDGPRVLLAFRCPKALRHRVKQRALAQGVTLEQFMLSLIRRELGEAA